MGHVSLGRNAKVTLINNGEVAGQGTITSDELDMTGFEGVLILVHMGTITGSAATTTYIRQDTATGLGSGATLAGSTHTIADTASDTIFLTDLYRPLEQFVDVQVTRATQNSVIQSIVAIQYNGRKPPVTHDASTVTAAIYLAGPSEA